MRLHGNRRPNTCSPPTSVCWAGGQIETLWGSSHQHTCGLCLAVVPSRYVGWTDFPNHRVSWRAAHALSSVSCTLDVETRAKQVQPHHLRREVMFCARRGPKQSSSSGARAGAAAEVGGHQSWVTPSPRLPSEPAGGPLPCVRWRPAAGTCAFLAAVFPLDSRLIRCSGWQTFWSTLLSPVALSSSSSQPASKFPITASCFCHERDTLTPAWGQMLLCALQGGC